MKNTTKKLIPNQVSQDRAEEIQANQNQPMVNFGIEDISTLTLTSGLIGAAWYALPLCLV